MNEFISPTLLESYVRAMRASKGKITHYVGVQESECGDGFVTIMETSDADTVLHLMIPREDNERLVIAEQAAAYIVEHEHLAARRPTPPPKPSNLYFWRGLGKG